MSCFFPFSHEGHQGTVLCHGGEDVGGLDTLQMQIGHRAESLSGAWSVTKAARAACGAPLVSLLTRIMLA